MSIYQPIGELLDEHRIIPINRPEAGDIILEYLKELEIEYIFGVPGGAIEPIFSAIARGKAPNSPKAVIARHEAGSVFMADGYARESGKIGVCLATTGPGATNMITGVASAYQDETPILVITGQPQIDQFGSDAVQESSCTGIDTVAMFKHCTCYSSLVSHPQQLERKLVSAVTSAYQHMRPVHLSIPLDIARSKYNPLPSRRKLPPFINHCNMIDIEMTEELSKRLVAALSPVFVIGEGCKKAINSILSFSELSGAKVVTTPQAKGLVNPYHKNFFGVCGLAGHDSAMKVLNSSETDLILVVGSTLEQFAATGWKPNDHETHKIIHVDSNINHLSKTHYSELNVTGNIKLVFDRLNKLFDSDENRLTTRKNTSQKNRKNLIPFERRRKDRRTRTENTVRDNRKRERRCLSSMNKPLYRNYRLLDELKHLDDNSPIKPQRLMYELSQRAPDNTRFLADIGNSFLWAIHYLNPYHKSDAENQNYLYMGMGFASMAWTVGAAIGVALAAPGKPVICIVGDGALLMSAHELTTAVQCKIPIIYIVLNDQAYGTCKHGQKLAGAESIGADLPPINFALYAKSIGANGVAVKSLDDLCSISLSKLSALNKPTLIDIHIDGDEPPPLSERLKMLASGRD